MTAQQTVAHTCLAQSTPNSKGGAAKLHRSKADIDLKHFRFHPKSGSLTPTRHLVAQMVCCGLADKEISYLLGIASQTVKFHVSQAMRTLGLQRRTQLVRYMFETNQFDPDEATAELKVYLLEKSKKPARFARFTDIRSTASSRS